MNDRQAYLRIKYLLLSAVEPVACKYFLWSLRGHPGENWSAPGQPHTGRPRQVENVITVQEEPEHFRSADDANAAVRQP